MELSKYVAVICEGAAEEAIMDILLDADRLIFNREMLLDENVIRSRSAEAFERRFLRKSMMIRSPFSAYLIPGTRNSE